MPTGGTANQVLSKIDGTDYNTRWATVSGVPAGGNAGQMLAKQSGNNYDDIWVNPPPTALLGQLLTSKQSTAEGAANGDWGGGTGSVYGSAYAHSGSGSWGVTLASGNNGVYARMNGAAQNFLAHPGDTIAVSGWVYATAAHWVQMKVDMYLGTVYATTVAVGTTTTPGTWAQITGTITVPAGADRVQLVLGANTSDGWSAGDNIYFDDLSFVHNLAAVPVLTGGTTGQIIVKDSATDFDVSWQSGLPLSPITTVTDCNLMTTAGLYWAQSGTATKQPTGGGSWHIWVYQAQDNPQIVTQVAVRATTSAASSAVNMYQRNGNAGTYTPWIPVLSDTGWKTLPLASGYQAYSGNTPQYRVLNGVVYYRGQVAPTSGNFIVQSVAIVAALPAEAQATIAGSGYLIQSAATSSASIPCRIYLAASNTAVITVQLTTSGAVYVDLAGLIYPLG